MKLLLLTLYLMLIGLVKMVFEVASIIFVWIAKFLFGFFMPCGLIITAPFVFVWAYGPLHYAVGVLWVLFALLVGVMGIACGLDAAADNYRPYKAIALVITSFFKMYHEEAMERLGIEPPTGEDDA